ncbi:MAG: alpha/beta fold hydrolase [Pseudoclavibacter sp.]|nr:alpha/beta fold hydrolase [Pseudoclavibacter sp.]
MRTRTPGDAEQRGAVAPLGAAGALLLGAAAAALAFASAGVTAAVMAARSLVTPPHRRPVLVRVRRYDPARGEIALERTPRSEAPGVYTIVYDGGAGAARIERIVGRSGRTVTRRVSEPVGSPLTGVRQVRLDSSPQRGPDDLELPWSETLVATDLGMAPAWVFRTREASTDWAVHVHGRGASRTEPLRSVPLFRAAGWNSLVISYRNDPQAPGSPDDRLGLGFTEWRDVAAAVEWALARGARRILLAGWSMGGAAVLQALLEMPDRTPIVGVMLESPVVSWRATLRLQGRLLYLPKPVIRLGEWLLSGPLARPVAGLAAPLPIRDGEIPERADRLRAPVLILHSREDATVPAGPSARLAALRPELVEYAEFARGQHTRLWNADPERWERVVQQWLAQFRTPERNSRE